MFKSRGYSAHRLLISFSSLIVVLLIITAFISYTAEIASEARVNMLKITDLQLQSTNRMLLSRATILNLHLAPKVDASLLSEDHKGGVLAYGEMVATTNNLSIFLVIDQLILKQGQHEGEVIFYTDEHRGELCSLTYYQPFVENSEMAKPKRHAARYVLNTKDC